MRRKPRAKGHVRVTSKPISSGPELSRHMLRAQEEERKRISRELHDETGQGLMVLRMYIANLQANSTDPAINSQFENTLALLDRTIEGLRRVIRRLSPRVLEELGLLEAIRKEARELSRNTGIKATLDLPEKFENVDPETGIAIYRTVQEALHNITKHAGAKKLRIQLTAEQGAISLIIEDDGVGISRKKAPAGQGFGLLGMRERIAALNGAVRIRSVKGKGTRICVLIPNQGSDEQNLVTEKYQNDCGQELGAA